MKVRRYLRGSGRVLAFVFIASVIWLLFDMAALRISINDVNSQLLKERVIREREIFKKQSRVTQLVERGLKHPVQKVGFAGTPAGKVPLNPGIKLAEVYRQGGKKRDQMLGDKKMSFEQQGDNLHPKYVLSEHKEGAKLQNVTPKHGVPAKTKAGNLDLKGTKLEKSKVIDVVLSNTTKETKQGPLTVSKKGLLKAGGVVQNALDNIDSKTTEKVKDEPKTNTGTKEGQLRAEETHPVKITSKPSNKDVNEKEVNTKTEEQHIRTIAKGDLNAAKETPKPTIKFSKDNSTAVKKPGVHKVLSLDATLVPRDANAVGQFGQAALVASNEDAEVRKRWDEGYFNVYLSDQIPVDRAIPDTRPET